MSQKTPDIIILYHKKDLLWLRWIEYFLRSRGYLISLVDFTSGQVTNVADWVVENSSDVQAVIIIEAEDMYASGSLEEEWGEKVGNGLDKLQVVMIRRKGLRNPKQAATFNSEFIGENEERAIDQMSDILSALQSRNLDRKKIASENIMVEPDYAGNLPRNFRMPYAHPLKFVGRNEEFNELIKAMKDNPQVVIKNRIGGRGFGLSTILTKYIYENIKKYSTVWWVPAHNKLLMAGALKDLGARYGVQGKIGSLSDMWVKILKAMSGKSKLPFMVILDRPTGEIMKDFEALADKPWKMGVLVALSGEPRLDNVPRVDVGVMNKEDSRALIFEVSGADDTPELEDLAVFLKNHPLLMRMAARVVKGGREINRYLEDFNLEGQLVKVEEPFLKPFMISSRLMIDQLQRVNSDAEKLLVFGSYFAALPIPACMFESSSLVDHTLSNVLRDHTRLNSAIGLLEEYGVVMRGLETFVVHPLISRCVRAMEDYQKDWPDIIIGILSEKLSPLLPVDTLEDRRGEVYPHAVEMCLERVRAEKITEDSVVLINNVANEARSLQNLSVATELLQGVMDYYLNEHGENSEDVSGLAVNLGVIYKLENKIDEAKTMFEKALRIDTSIFGSQNINVAEDHAQLARLESAKKNFVEADAHFSKAVSIMKSVLGNEHPRLAKILTDYIVVLKGLKNSAPIYGYAKTVVEIETKLYGEDSPRICNALANLGLAAAAAGQFGEAIIHLQKSMVLEERVFGPHHPKVAVRAGQLADVMERNGNVSDAAYHYGRALGIFSSTIGLEHPSTKLIAECAARTREAQGLPTR